MLYQLSYLSANAHPRWLTRSRHELRIRSDGFIDSAESFQGPPVAGDVLISAVRSEMPGRSEALKRPGNCLHNLRRCPRRHALTAFRVSRLAEDSDASQRAPATHAIYRRWCPRRLFNVTPGGVGRARAAVLAGTPTGDDTAGGGPIDKSKTREGRIGQVGHPVNDLQASDAISVDAMQVKQGLMIRLRNVTPIQK